MKNTIYISLFFFLGVSAYAQKKICICFDENTKHIKMQISKDSTRASFSITKPGFETQKDRDRAMEEYKERGPYHYPTFTIGYVAGKFYQLQSLEFNDCALILSVEKFRKRNFDYPKGIGSNKLIFIKKKSENSYLLWDAISVD